MTLQVEAPTRSLVRVLIVDDSAFMRTALSKMIASETGFEVVGTAWSGSDALVKIAALNPDVVTLDIEMPGLNGIETLQRIMADFPRPVIMVSATTERDAHNTFIALKAGAFDYVPKQLSAQSLDILHIRDDLIAKIRAAAQSRTLSTAETAKKPPQSLRPTYADGPRVPPSVIALGASTGGPKALQEILPLLPGELPASILIVQHMPVGFTTPFAQRLNSLCSLEVREGADEEPILPGVAYVAPAGMQMLVRGRGSQAFIHLDAEIEGHLHTPSVDVLMKSVAEHFGNLAMGVILTGMGSDGAEGMNAIRQRGGLTIGQDEASCTVYGMPRVCAEAGSLVRVLPLLQIPDEILAATRCRKRA